MLDARNHYAKDGSAIPVRFTRLNRTLFIILAGLLTLGQGLTQWRLRGFQQELWVIRYAALQRQQSQQLVQQALQLIDPNGRANFGQNLAEMRHLFPIFARYHLQGRQGRVYERNLTVTNSDKVQRLYESIRPQFEAFRRGTHRLIRLHHFSEVSQPDVKASLQLLLANEKPFLLKMDAIVREYTGELRAKLTLLQAVEFSLYVFTVLVLAGISWLIFRPATRRLKQTVARLVEAESQTMAVNKKLLAANKSLKETRQQLFEATKQQYERQMDEQKMRTSYLIAGQEEERKRLSRELHDGLGQMLTAIKLQIEGLEANLTKAAPTQAQKPATNKSLRTLKNLVTQTIGETRTISNNLMPTVLSDFGVVPAIKMLAESDRSEKIDVLFETNLTAGAPRLDRNVEIMLYRVAQEALSNAVRHANPSHIRIELMEQADRLQLSISDDGRGFRLTHQTGANRSPKPAEKDAADSTAHPLARFRPPSQGLHNMQERAELLNGKVNIHSTPGKGTSVLVTIPRQIQTAHHGTD